MSHLFAFLWWLMLFVVSLANPLYEEAINLYHTDNATTDDIIKAQSIIDELIALNPTSSEYYNLNGILLEELNELNQSEMNYQKACNLSNYESSTILYNYAALLINKLGKLHEAKYIIQQFNISLSNQQMYTAQSYQFLANYYHYSGDAQISRQLFEKSLQLDPYSLSCLFDYVQMLYRHQMWNDSLLICDRIISLNTEFVGSYMIKGLIFMDIGDYIESEKMLKICVGISNQCKIDLGFLYLKMRDVPSYLEIYNDETIRNDPYWHLMHAYALSMSRMHQEANNIFFQLVTYYMQDKVHYLNIQSIHRVWYYQGIHTTFYENEPLYGIPYLLKVLEYRPKYTLAYYQIAIAYGSWNMYDEALNYLDKAFELNPDIAEFRNNGYNELRNMLMDEIYSGSCVTMKCPAFQCENMCMIDQRCTFA